MRKSSRKLAIKKLYIVRHGQTDYNKRGVVQGSGIDASLNEQGRLQAQAFFEAYKSVPFDHAFYSGLQRTRQSIELFLDSGIASTSVPELNEIHWGKQEGQPFSSAAKTDYEATIAAWAAGNLDAKMEGGESAYEMGERLQKALNTIIEHPGDTLLVCMHGRAMRALLALMLHYPLTAMDSFPHANLCLYQATHTGTMFRLDKTNDQQHLAGLS